MSDDKYQDAIDEVKRVRELDEQAEIARQIELKRERLKQDSFELTKGMLLYRYHKAIDGGFFDND